MSSEPFCTELFVHTCCDPVYTDFDGSYRAVAHRGGKDMFYNSRNGYSIFYNEGDGGFWSIRSEEDTELFQSKGIAMSSLTDSHIHAQIQSSAVYYISRI